MSDTQTTLPRRAARLGAGRQAPAGSLALALVAVVILAMAWHFAAYLGYALAAVRYPYELDYGEGIVWQQAVLIPGERMYGDIARFPFVVFHYPPLYHLVVRAVAALGVGFLAAGRGVSLASSLAVGVLAAALAFRAVRDEAGRLASLAGATVAGLGVFCVWPVVVWSPLMRVDMLAIALSLLGVWCAARAAARPRLLYLAMVAFVLAVYAKQTCIAAPLATVPVMLSVAPSRTLRAVLFGLLLAGTALAALTWATHGGFLRHILLYNLNRYSLASAAGALRLVAWHLAFVALAVAALVAGWNRLAAGQAWTSVAAFRRNLAGSDGARCLAILTLYLGLSTAMLATLGKSGGGVNYLIEWMCVLSVLVGTLVALIAQQELARVGSGELARPRPVHAILVPVALILQVLILPSSRDLGASNPARMRELGQLVARIRDAKQAVLSDDMTLLMKAGKEVPWEPAIFAELASTGRWDERRIVDMIAARRFAFVITQGRSSTSLYDSRYTPAVSRAIEAAYPRTAEQAGHTLHLPPE